MSENENEFHTPHASPTLPPKPQPMNNMPLLHTVAETLPYDITKMILPDLPPEMVESSKIPHYDKARTFGTRSYKQRKIHEAEMAKQNDYVYPSHQFEMDADWWAGPGYAEWMQPKNQLERAVAAIPMSSVPGPRENVDYPSEPSRVKRNPSRDWHREFPNFTNLNSNYYRNRYDDSMPNFRGWH